MSVINPEPPSLPLKGSSSGIAPDGRLLPPRSTVRLSSRIDAWDDDPIRFVAEAFQPDKGGSVTLAPWAEEFMLCMRTERRVTIRACRNASKTTTLGFLSLWWVTRRERSKVIFSATRKDQLNDANWAEMKYWVSRMEPSLRQSFNISGDMIRVGGTADNFIAARAAAADNIAASLGQHSDNFLWAMDEASGIADGVFNAAIGSMTTPGSAIVLSGNPTNTSGFFYRTHMHPDLAQLWRRFHISVHDVKDQPWFDEGWIEFARAQWGEDSAEWQSYVLGEFPTAQEKCIIPIYAIHDAILRDVVKTDGYFPIWGFDPAAGGDCCALAKRQANVLLEPVKRWRERFVSESVKVVVHEFHQAKDQGNPPAAICVDATVIGIQVAEDLRKLGLPIIGVQFGGRATRPDMYQNMRVQLYFSAAEWFKSGIVKMPADDHLVEELAVAKYEIPEANSTDGNRKRGYLMQPKLEIKKQIGRSPDSADALVLTFAAPHRERDAGYLSRTFGALRDRYRRRDDFQGSWMAL